MTDIESIIRDHHIVIFMKGTKDRPFCGFSRKIVAIFESLSADFHCVDVLADEILRQDLKEFSDWPTFPQIYIDQEFVGGCDIISQMYENGDLEKLLKPQKSMGCTNCHCH